MRTYITHKGDAEGPDIEACDHAHAQTLALEMDEDLVVDGELRLTISSEAMTDATADTMIRAMADEDPESLDN